jgi:hypothetical protein
VIQRIVAGLLGFLTLVMVAGFVLSFVFLVVPSGCSEDDLGCSVGSGSFDTIAGFGLVVFGALSLLCGWALQAWRRRHDWD